MKPLRLALFLILFIFHVTLVVLVLFFPTSMADSLLGEASGARFLVLFGLAAFLVTFGIVWLDRRAARKKIERLEAEKDKIKAEVFDMRQREQEVEREIASFKSSLPPEKDRSSSLPPAGPTTSESAMDDPVANQPAASNPAAGDPVAGNPAVNESTTEEAEYGTLEPRPGSALNQDPDDDEPHRS